MIASQAEYSWNFYKRWGAVAFAGTGLRFMVSPAKKINLRLDYVWGIDENQGHYFGMAEAF